MKSVVITLSVSLAILAAASGDTETHYPRAIAVHVSALSKSGPKPGETKEQYEQRVLAEALARDHAVANTQTTSTPDAESASAEAHSASTGSPESSQSLWVYSQKEDGMGRGTLKFAICSVPSLSLTMS